MKLNTPGLHHVTAIAVDPQANLDFYARVLGLRLVKQTVNFDDPGTYHFYFGDPLGHPGTILTFFPFPLAGRGRNGAGVAETVAFAAPSGTIDDWIVRLAGHGIDVEGPGIRFGEPIITVRDPDGLPVEIVAAEGRDPADADRPHALQGLHSVTLAVADPERTATVLTETLGLHAAGQSDGRLRFHAHGGDTGTLIDVRAVEDDTRIRLGGGSIHHIAFRARDEEELQTWREAILQSGLEVTPVMDRNYFRSIYFREPGGVLFEMATDDPGFAVDEAPEALGRTLKLPAWLEARRETLESRLPPIRVPEAAR
jgi:glyoxalase family protein